jgi:hypothetical protein
VGEEKSDSGVLSLNPFVWVTYTLGGILRAFKDGRELELVWEGR